MVVVRPIIAEEITALYEIASTTREFVCNDTIPDFWAFRELVQWQKSEPMLVQGAFHEEALVGFCLGHLHTATAKLHLENLMVLPHLRRSGIGRQLIESVMREGLKRVEGHLRIVCVVRSDNDGIQCFLRQLGWMEGEAMLWYQMNV